MTGYTNNDTARILMKVNEGIANVKSLLANEYFVSNNETEVNDLKNELLLLTAIKKMIEPRVKEMIEKIANVSGGEISSCEDIVSYENYGREITEKELERVRKYLGMIYKDQYLGDYGLCVYFTSNDNEISQEMI